MQAAAGQEMDGARVRWHAMILRFPGESSDIPELP
jgi:hypothetical protein